jgi:succinate dehydrogenase / fumarate reductase, flavoprotein subunit
MEIAPTAHYSMGGVLVRADTHATDVQGLYAVGEVAAGVHGANRLGGNSLVELIVFGRIVGGEAGRYVAAEGVPPLDDQAVERAVNENRSLLALDGARQRALIAELQETIWRGVGVVRHADGLRQALNDVERIGREADGAVSDEPDLVAALDLRAMLVSAEATIRAADLRRESRGAHQRRDYGEQDPEWQRRIVLRPRPIRDRPYPVLDLDTIDIPPTPEAIIAVFSDVELDNEGRLVE